MEHQALMVALVGVTSAGAYLIGVTRLGLSGRGLRGALGHMLEGIGLTLLFLAANVTLGVIGILAARALTRWFVSIYLMSDIAWVAFSLVQGLTFHWWWRR